MDPIAERNSMDNETTFAQVYEKHLRAQVQKKPDDYGYGPDHVPVVVGKMVSALKRGSANKDGPAIRATCKELSIPYRYKDIAAFLNS